LNSRGARVIVHGRDSARVNAVAADLGAKSVEADLREPGASEHVAAAARDVYGQVDAVVHCAGIGWLGPSAEMTPQTVADLIEVNLAAPVRITRELLGEMTSRGFGHVSFLASIAGWTGVNQEALYSATKSAVITFADTLRIELASSGVGVSVISPAAVRTPFFDRRGVPYDRTFPRPLEPERVAAAVVRSIEDDVAHQMIPRWLALAPAVRATMPGVFRQLNRRFGQRVRAV